MQSCVHESLVVNDPELTPGEQEPPPVESETCDEDTVYFMSEVLPILVSNCAKSGCHNAATAEEDIILDSYANVMGSDVVDAGDASDSEMYERITEDDDDKVMPPPPHQKLSSSQVLAIRTWINQGAKNNACIASTCDTAIVTFNLTIKPLLTSFCSGCHSGNTPSGGLNFTTHLGSQIPALDGRLLGAVTHAVGFTPMPQGGGKLTDCNISKISKWIDEGAPNN
jgi:hypothetical protein